MKNALTLLASVLALSFASAQAIAMDARTERLLTKAQRTAHAAARTYAKQPNGTTHALADVASCNFSAELASARSRGLDVSDVEAYVEALSRLRAAVKLPEIECTRTNPPLKI